MSEPELTFYTRAGCTLCEKAARLLLERGVSLTPIDIGGNELLEKQYGWDIPVLIRDGQVLLKGVFTPARLERIGL